MAKFRVRIEGTRKGLLMNPKTPDLLEQLRTRVRKPPKTDISVFDEAAGKIIRDSQGRIGIPDQYLWSCLVEAGRGIKLDARRSVSTADSSMLAGLVEIEMDNEEDFIPFVDQGAKWMPLVMGGKNPADGVAVTITRPLFRHWAVEFVLDVDDKEISPEKIRQLVARAGKFVGIGDFRAACKGRFGGFAVTKWVSLEPSKNHAAPAAVPADSIAAQ